MLDFVEILSSFVQSLILFKIFFLTLSLFYTIFLLIVLKQVNSMNAVISEEGPSAVLKSVAIINIALSVALFLTGLVIL